VPKRRRKEPKPLRCHGNLHVNTDVKPAVIPRNIKSNNIKKLSERRRIKLEQNILNSREREGKVHRKKAAEVAKIRRITRNKLPNTGYDLWAEDNVNSSVKEVAEYHEKYTKKTKPKAPQRLRAKPSVVPAIEVSHPGASYNPAFDDHQELLKIANEVEIKKLKEESKLEERLAPMQKMSWNEIEQSWIQEMSLGLDGEEEEEEEDGSDSEDADDLTTNPPVRRENKKTEKQRKKEKLKLEKEKKLQEIKMKKIKDSQRLRLKSIKKEVNEIVKQREAKASRKAEKRKAAIANPKKLGKLKFETPDLELQLSDELKGSLRLLKPEGHLLVDRFKSFQKRNIIEPRKRAKHIKWTYKPKSYEKKDHRAIKA
ncbi:ribosome biogenesis protein NOP53-like, partial [Lingula anatina]|uniref:Ribosome biogenesis protein NOP53 n=1 Tax=Lingula anatina TaxID=7574 RepID=A0A1S3ITV7_LINAN